MSVSHKIVSHLKQATDRMRESHKIMGNLHDKKKDHTLPK